MAPPSGIADTIPGVIEFPEVVPGEPIRVSASSYVAFRQCPGRAEAHFAGVYSPDTRASFSGGLAHRIFARHLEKGEISPDGFEQACREEIGTSNLNFKMGTVGLKPTSLGHVIEEVGLLYERFKRITREGFQSSEVGFEVEAAEGVELVGRIDAVFGDEGGVRLVDWKTGNLGEVEDQLGFYALLWAMDRHELPASVEAVSVATGDRYEEVPLRSDVVTTSQRVAFLVNEMRRAWDRGIAVERRGGPWCRYCPVLEGCEEGSAAVDLLD